jgi:hypothetical protein
MLKPSPMHSQQCSSGSPCSPGPPGPVAFACTLAQAQPDLLNYKIPGDAKIYTSTTVKLSTTFSLNKPNISILLAELGDCSNSASWTTTLQIGIATVPAAAGVAAIPAAQMDLFQDFGHLLLPNIGSQ